MIQSLSNNLFSGVPRGIGALSALKRLFLHEGALVTVRCRVRAFAFVPTAH